MKEIITKIFCDLCKVEITTVRKDREYPMLTTFMTNQDDGYACTPFLSIEYLHLCPECLKAATIIVGSGCQGNNKYHWKPSANPNKPT